MDLTQVASPSSGVPSCAKEGTLLYRAGTTYLGKELWKSCYLVLRYGQIKYVSTPQLLSTCSFKYALAGFHKTHCTSDINLPTLCITNMVNFIITKTLTVRSLCSINRI